MTFFEDKRPSVIVGSCISLLLWMSV